MNKFVIIGIISLLFNFAGYAPYYRDIFKNKVKPQRITWRLWTILNLIAAVNQIRNGGGWATLFVLSTLVFVSGVFLLSFKKGIGGGSKMDKVSLLIAGLLFMWWIFSRDSVYSTYLALAIDSIGAVLTGYKAYKKPETEAYLQWLTSGIAAGISILALEKRSILLLAYPVYIIFGNAVIVLAKYFGTKKGESTA